MAEFDSGISAEEAGINMADYDLDTGVEDTTPEVAEAVETSDTIPEDLVDGEDGVAVEDAWAWTQEKGVTPEQVRSTWENYTQKTQNLSAREKELEPYIEFAEELRADQALQNIIREYYESGMTPEREIQNLAQELNTMKTQMAVETELNQLVDFVEQNHLPEFDSDALLQYAVDNNLPSLSTAYKDMMFDAARDAVRDSLEKDIKKSKGAALPKTGKSDSAGNTRPTAADIANMSEEDFISGYGGIVSGFSNK